MVALRLTLKNEARGLYDCNAVAPVLPEGAEPRPQQPLSGAQLGPFDGALKDADLMAQCKHLELKRGSSSEERGDKGKECAENRVETDGGETHLISPSNLGPDSISTNDSGYTHCT
jgi:hypothetical protein